MTEHLSYLIDTLLNKTMKSMPLDNRAFENPPDCNTKINDLLLIHEKKVVKNRELREKLTC